MKEALKNRTKKFAIDCWQLCKTYANSREYDAFCRQLIRCSSSVGANYRAACRAKSQESKGNTPRIRVPKHRIISTIDEAILNDGKVVVSSFIYT